MHRLVVVPDGPRTDRDAAGRRGIGAHPAHRDAVALVVVVDDQQPLDTRLREPGGDRLRTRAVVGHHAHERGAAEADPRCHRGDLEEVGLGEHRCGRCDLGRVEVAEVGERRGIGGRIARGRDRPRLPVVRVRVVNDRLDPGPGTPERELGAAQRVAPGLSRRSGQREAHVDAHRGATLVDAAQPARLFANSYAGASGR